MDASIYLVVTKKSLISLKEQYSIKLIMYYLEQLFKTPENIK
jgi:hypothetical protein